MCPKRPLFSPGKTEKLAAISAKKLHNLDMSCQMCKLRQNALLRFWDTLPCPRSTYVLVLYVAGFDWVNQTACVKNLMETYCLPPFRNWYWIISPIVPWMAADNPLKTKPSAFYNSKLFYRFVCILRAAWMKAAKSLRNYI